MVFFIRCHEEPIIVPCAKEDQVPFNEENYQYEMKEECCRLLNVTRMYLYDSIKQVYDTTRTSYNYDAAGKLISTTTTSMGSDEIEQFLLYDQQGLHIGYDRWYGPDTLFSYNQKNQLEGYIWHDLGMGGPCVESIAYFHDSISVQLFYSGLYVTDKFYINIHFNGNGNVKSRKSYKAIMENGEDTGRSFMSEEVTFTYDNFHKPVQRIFEESKLTEGSLSQNNILIERGQYYNQDGSKSERRWNKKHEYEYNEFGYPVKKTTVYTTSEPFTSKYIETYEYDCD